MAREPELVKYLTIVRALEQRFQGFTLKYIPRAENSEADELAKAATNNWPTPDGTFYQVLQAPATQATVKAFKQVLLTQSKDWRQSIIDQINNIQHSEDEASIARMDARARSHTLVNGILYKKICSPIAALMHNPGRRQRAPQRNSLENIRLTHCSKSTICEGHQAGILLAHTHQRCRRNCQDM
jgi:hypothetical protein